MTIRDMHIEIAQSLQQVASNRTRKILDEEIDWAFNKIQDRFIRSCLRPREMNGVATGGFEVDQLHVDKIRRLLVSYFPIQAYWDGTRYQCHLPADYSYLISDWSMVVRLCGAAIQSSSVSLNVVRARQNLSPLSAAPYYATMSIALGGRTVALPADLPYGNTYTGQQDKGDIDFLVPWILNRGGWYWERFGSLYYPKHYLWVGATVPSTAVVTVDSNTVTGQTVDTLALTIHTGTGKREPNRLTPSSIVPNILDIPFFGTAPYSPVSELSGNILYIYRDNSFTVTGTFISYIRKPQPMSLSLNTDCELPPEFHQTICDLTAKYLKGALENEKGVALSKEDLEERVIL